MVLDVVVGLVVLMFVVIGCYSSLLQVVSLVAFFSGWVCLPVWFAFDVGLLIVVLFVYCFGCVLVFVRLFVV